MKWSSTSTSTSTSAASLPGGEFDFDFDSDLGSLTIQRGWRRDASACDDPRAENAGADQPCSYDCATLQSFYFPDEDSRCFAYDVATGWPAGEHDRLHVLAGLGFHSVAVLQSYSA